MDTALPPNSMDPSTSGLPEHLDLNAKLSEALHFNEQILASAREGIVVYGPDLRYLVWNPFMERLTGRTAGEVLGRQPEEVFPFLVEAGVIDNLKAILAGGPGDTREFHFEVQDTSRSGWASDNSGPLYNDRGEVIGVIGVVRDSTESKRIADELQEREYFFRESQRAGSVGSYRADFVKGRWQSSAVLDGIFGIDERYERTIQGWLDLIHPEDRTVMARYLTEEVIGRRRPFAKEYRIVRQLNPSTRWVFGRGEGTFDAEGRFLTLTGTIQDITDRRRLERARDVLLEISEATQTVPTLEELLSRIHACISELLPARNFYVAVLDAKTGGLTFPYFADEVDAQPSPRKRGRTLTDLVLSDGEARLLTAAALEALQETGAVAINGTPPRMWLGVPLLGPEGPFGVLAVQTYADEVCFHEGDVDLLRFVSTQVASSIRRKQAEEEHRSLETQLAQSQKMESLGVLAGGVAHDMNNVLGAILALASAHLAIQSRNSSTYPAFETIRDAAIRGGEMVKRLLNFARNRPRELRRVDLNGLLKEQARLLERTTLAKVRLHLDLAPDLCPIDGDASALTHAVMNLCVNGVDAMGEGGTLTLRTFNDGGAQVAVVVEDTGAGMTPETLARAFDPFFTTKEVGKGTGLGLSMVYTTVKAHGGQVELQSRPGGGTQVKLLFPAGTAAGPEPGTAGPEPSEPTRNSLRLLLIDDDDLILKAIRMLAEVLGHTATLASSGEAAHVLVEQGCRPDAIILDLNMPGWGGKGTLPRLRALCPHTPILLATGRVGQDALDLIATYPDVALLAKPFSLEDLREGLARIERRA